MSFSVKYQEIDTTAKAYDHKLLATDTRFNRTVTLSHVDGSFFKWRRAFVMERTNWIIVFTEHHGYHIYDKDDLNDVTQFDTRIQSFDELT